MISPCASISVDDIWFYSHWAKSCMKDKGNLFVTFFCKNLKFWCEMHKRIVINFYIKAFNVYVHTHWKYFNHSSTSYFVDYMKCFISFFLYKSNYWKSLSSPFPNNWQLCRMYLQAVCTWHWPVLRLTFLQMCSCKAAELRGCFSCGLWVDVRHWGGDSECLRTWFGWKWVKLECQARVLPLWMSSLPDCCNCKDH